MKPCLLSLVLAAILAVPSLAFAGDEERLQDQITQYNVILADLKKTDTEGVATRELATLQSWLTQAQTKLATDDVDPVELIVRRFKPQVGLVRAILERATATDKLQKMREDDLAFREEARQLETRAKELEKRRRELKDAVEARRPDRGGFKRPAFGGSP